MIQAPDLPLWAALLIAVFVLLGAVMTLIGSLGLVRLESFHERMHAPTLGATMGLASIVTASVISLSVLEQRLVVHELLIGLFVTVTTPVAFMLLARAALYRSRIEQGALPGSEDTE